MCIHSFKRSQLCLLHPQYSFSKLAWILNALAQRRLDPTKQNNCLPSSKWTVVAWEVVQVILYKSLISILFCFCSIFLLSELLLFAGKSKAPKYVHCVLPSNPPKSIWTKWENVAFYCTAVTLQCDPPSRSRWTDTMSFYLVPKWPAQHFISWPVVKNIGMERWWLLLKVTCTHVCSLYCYVSHKLTWQGDIDPELHESCTIDTLCTARIVPDCLCCGRLRIFVLSTSTVCLLWITNCRVFHTSI